MIVVFVRHGETVEGIKNIILGSLPGVLTNKGEREIENLGLWLKGNNIHPASIISSNLERAKNSAVILRETFPNISLTYSSLLQERASGFAEGKTEEEIDWEEYEKKDIPNRKHKGGESFLEVKERAALFLKSLTEKKGNTLIVVTHSVFILMILSILREESIEESLQNNIKNKVVIYNTETKEVKITPVV